MSARSAVRIETVVDNSYAFAMKRDGAKIFIRSAHLDKMEDALDRPAEAGDCFICELAPNPKVEARSKYPWSVTKVVGVTESFEIATTPTIVTPSPTSRTRTPLETSMDALLDLVGGDGSARFNTPIPTEEQIALVVMTAIPPTDPSFVPEVKRLMAKSTMLGLKHKTILLAQILGMEKVTDTILAEGIGALPPVTLDELINGEEKYASPPSDTATNTAAA